MALSTQFQVLQDQLRHELKQSANAAHGTNALSAQKHAINAAYETVYDMYAWPHLKGRYDVEMEDGERYYDLPVSGDTITRVEYKFNEVWTTIDEGIVGADFNSQDSDDDDRADPVQKWMRYGLTQFEVWPIPATDGGTVRFYGRRAFVKLVATTDTAFIDDRLIVLRAAIKLSTGEDREAKVEEFTDAFRNLKKRAQGAQSGAVLGDDEGPLSRRPSGPVRFAVSTD